MEYTVVSSKWVESLIIQVNKHIAQGWRPLGGVAVEAHGGYDGVHPSAEYFQAMIRGDE